MHSLIKFTALAVCTGLLTAATAHAGTFRQTRHQTVSFADLDLTRPEGLDALRARISAAASAVCGGTPDVREMRQWQNYQSCAKQAADTAMADVLATLTTDSKSRLAQAQ